MSERMLKQLVGAFAIVAAIWLVTMLVGRGSGSIQASGEVASLFEGLTAANLESATFVYRGDEVRLARDDDGWRVNGYPADPVTTSRFAAGIGDLRVGDLTASNPDNHARMGVTVDSAISVTLVGGGESPSFLLGNTGSRFGTAYLRLADSDDVYLLDGDLRSHATRAVDAWRSRTMATVDTSSIEEIEVRSSAAGYTIMRADSAWVLSDGASADPDAVQGILSELSNFMATGFVSEGDDLAGEPEASATIARSADGTELVTITLGAGEGDRWARTSSDEYLYTVSSFRSGRVAPTREAMLGSGG